MRKVTIAFVFILSLHCLAKAQTENYQLNGFEISLTPATKSITQKGIAEKILANKTLRQKLGTNNYLVLSEEALPQDNAAAENNLFLVTIYDYTRNICLLVTAAYPYTTVGIKETTNQPNPGADEFDKSVAIILSKDARLAKAYAGQSISFVRPMPPLDLSQTVNGITQRTLTLGIQSADPAIKNEIVGINMVTQSVVHYATGAPPTSRVAKEQCGADYADQKTTKRKTGDPYQLVIQKNGVKLWSMLVSRPSASSGTNASGVELEDVFYLGSEVLKQAHVPILNVRYDSNKCGPYRDWLYEESYFTANGKDAAEGFRLCPKRPTTIFDTESDTGNFQGVAIWASDSAVSLISETEAGWYRYVMKWTFYANGTIVPKFEFGAVKNACVCNVHHHHVYWRFDFAMNGQNNNQVQQYSDGLGWKDVNTEVRALNDTALHRKWRVMNTNTNAAYTLVPGENDGVEDEDFGKGDVWILHYKNNEVDDHVKQYMRKKAANIDQFVTGESTANTDIVVWYAAHFTHDIHNESIDHEVGPRLIFSAPKSVAVNENISSITVAPNPVTGLLKISGLPNQKTILKVINRNGNVVQSATSNTSVYNLDVSRLPADLYTLQVISNGKTQTVTFIKQ